MTAQQRAFTLTRLCRESMSVVTEPVDRADMPVQVPRTWITTMHDRALPVRVQRRSIRALGGVDHSISIDACHDAMISDPVPLAQILIERCRSYQ